MLGLFNATMRPGIELVLDLLHAREACAWADVVITGEGSIDGQTPYGKVPSGIAPGPAALPELLTETKRNVEATCAAIASLLSVARECSSRPHQ